MIRTGIGYDIHRFAAGRRLILGGVEIPSPEGLDGHSDADVVCHALADALLGAVADGDIGQHFPNTDPAWKNADSVMLLAGESNIREVIAFPMNQKAQDLMMNAPNTVTEKQLRELHLKVDMPKEKNPESRIQNPE